MLYKGYQGALDEKKERKWLCQRGKGHVLPFTDQEIAKLRECFGALDGDGSGSIGVEELDGPLIGLGFADNTEQIEEMIDDVDDDKSGQIEFEEFLAIIKSADSKEKTAKINKFFKEMSNGTLGKKDESFNMIVQSIRRKYMMDAVMGEGNEKEYGMLILQNVKKILKSQKERMKEEQDGDESD